MSSVLCGSVYVCCAWLCVVCVVCVCVWYTEAKSE